MLESLQQSLTSQPSQHNHLKTLSRIIHEQQQREEQLQSIIQQQQMQIQKYQLTIVKLTHGYQTTKQYYQDQIRQLKCQLAQTAQSTNQPAVYHPNDRLHQPALKEQTQKSGFLYSDRSIYQRFTAISGSDHIKEEAPKDTSITGNGANRDQSESGSFKGKGRAKEENGRQECSQCTLLSRRLQVCEDEVARLGAEHYKDRTQLQEDKEEMESELAAKNNEIQRLKKRVGVLKGQIVEQKGKSCCQPK